MRHEIYNKLAAAKVQYIITTVLDRSDFEDHHTLNGDYAQSPRFCKINLKAFRALQHYRLVLQEIGCSLTSFNDLREPVRCWLLALSKVRTILGILQRVGNRSAENIVIYTMAAGYPKILI